MIIEANGWYAIFQVLNENEEKCRRLGWPIVWKIFFWRIMCWEKTEEGKLVGYVNTRGFAINTVVDAAEIVACGRDHLPLVYKHVSDFSEEERELAQAIFSQRAKPYKKPDN